MNIRFGTIFCLAFSIMAFNAHSINMDHLNIKLQVEEYLAYMMGDDPIRYVRYFYVYVICRMLKGKFANQTLPLSFAELRLYLNGSLSCAHAEMASRLSLKSEVEDIHGFSIESMLDYSYWVYWWAVASDSTVARALIWAMPGTLLYENYDLYGLIAGFLSTDHRTRSIY